MVIGQRAWGKSIPISSIFRPLYFELNWNVFKLSPSLVILSLRNMHLYLLCARHWTLAWEYKWSRDGPSNDLVGEMVELGGEDSNSPKWLQLTKKRTHHVEKARPIKVCNHDLIYWNGPEKTSRRQKTETHLSMHGEKSKDHAIWRATGTAGKSEAWE